MVQYRTYWLGSYKAERRNNKDKMMSTDHFTADTKVFISYAKEDRDEALLLFKALQDEGASPWIDIRCLLPGERWEEAILREIRQADVVVVLLSDQSVKKRGFIQKEIRTALRLWEEKLEDDIYLIPVRLDDCKPPEALAGFQWVDLWSSDGLGRLVLAIENAKARKNVDRSDSMVGSVTVKTVQLRERSDVAPKFSASVEFPRFGGPVGLDSLERANASVARSASDLFEDFVTTERDLSRDPELAAMEMGTSVLNSTYSVTLGTRRLLSVRCQVYLYGAGAAHGNIHYQHFNYQLEPFRTLLLGDIFQESSGWRDAIRKWCAEDLSRQYVVDGFSLDGYTVQEIDSGTRDIESVGFNLTPRTVVFQWAPYAVGCYAWGPRQVVLPFKRLVNLVSDATAVFELVQGTV